MALVKLPLPLPPNMLREELTGDGAQVTAQTIKRMQDLVTLGKREPKIRMLVGRLAAQCPNKDYFCYGRQAFLFCRDDIRYSFDPSGVELIESPSRILETRVADCDSIVILLASICECFGFSSRFVTIKADVKRPDEFSHVFLEVKIPHRGWIGADCTQPGREFGWQPGPEFPRKTWPASNDEPEDAREDDKMAGLDGPIPGIETTPGVLVTSEAEFRDEPTLILMSPEQMELEPFGEKAADMLVGGQPQDFWAADQIEQLPAMQMGELRAAPESMLTGKNLLIAGGVALALWLCLRKK